MTPLLGACSVVITLETEKCRKRAPRSVEVNVFINCDRHKWFSQNKRRRADLQISASHFLIFTLGLSYDLSKFSNDLICTTPRLCQNNMTPVALRGRGTTSASNCFLATGLYFKSKVLASVGRGSTETTRLQHGSSVFGDTHAKGGGGGSSDKHGYMAFLILAK